ncbi:MAG: 23S rRNA pseudouridine2605 synthase [Candidatus Marinamargulisbacteria bacterium]|jgi:23S rRNA pseudouridine2605 synthase
MKLRIQKYLSQEGILSRRKTEHYIQKGWIKVNGEVVTEMGLKIDPESDIVTLDDQVNEEKKAYHYIAFHKPQGIVTNCPTEDEREITDLLPQDLAKVSSVGRLDKDSEGLILLTTDGIFARACLGLNPPHERIYEVWIDGNLSDEQSDKLEAGNNLFGEPTRPLQLTLITPNHFTLTMIEGKNRQVRRILQKVGHRVIRLKRLSFGSIHLDDLKPGHWVSLTENQKQAFLEP